jgi:pyrroloquinoline-quinone synthase
MARPGDLLERLDGTIEERNLLDHSFYRKWAAGTLPRSALQDYARQYYAFESTFPKVLSALLAREERPEARQALLENLWDEEHGADNHAELWLRFAEGAGVPRDETGNAEWNPATRDLVETYRRVGRKGPVEAGVAAIYAYERQVPALAETKVAGLDRYGVPRPARRFFEVHATLDVEHSNAERRIIEDTDASDEKLVVDAAEQALDAWWAFLDGVDPQGVAIPPED